MLLAFIIISNYCNTAGNGLSVQFSQRFQDSPLPIIIEFVSAEIKTSCQITGSYSIHLFIMMIFIKKDFMPKDFEIWTVGGIK